MPHPVCLFCFKATIAIAGFLCVWAIRSDANELPQPPTVDRRLAELIQPLIDAHDGKIGLAIKHLGNGNGFVYRADDPMPTASLIKMAVMVTAYDQIHAGTLSRTLPIALKEQDKVPGSGILTAHFSEGTQLSLRDAIRLMMAYSDNTATNLVVDQISLPATATLMKSLNLPNTQLHSKVYRRDTSIDLERSKQFGLGSTTAAETIAMLEWIDRGQIINREICDEMLEHLYANQDSSKLARSLPAKVRVAHKSGDVNASRCDAGLVDGPQGRIAICVLTDENADRSWSDNNAALKLMGEIAAVTYRHYYPEAFNAASSVDGTEKHLRIGSGGLEVESIQRTLNAKLVPSPQLDIDGDFGSATEQAMMRFQESAGLTATGIVDEATKAALGAPVATESAAATAPLIDEAADKEKAKETLDGPPVVSCKAWAIADAQSGDLLFEYQGNKRLDNASTTKLMTAWLVAKLAAVDPSILDESITFSKRADETSGSTAGIRTGEKVRVGDLLYGLLLPSGNDASVALAEHFGSRFALPTDDAPKNLSAEESYDMFVKAMNEEAQALGLKQTGYANPHGLTAKGHGASAVDLCQLAAKVLQDPTLAPIISNRRYLYKVQTSDGGSRDLVWRNTNQLLDIEGYDGLKTGTTNAAGACLVASGNRDGKRLIVVVLGASGSEARYADSRNLFRWAWAEIGKR
ncbi:MAG TPA: hypothetical protein DDZ51_24350 [Planctomycetaceae bacterium]|nr:hypothetical protein [Planctomycetaceae bacterium]